MMIAAKNAMPIANNILFGPAGFCGTAAPLMTVKTGVFSWSLALAACNCVFNAL